VARRTENISYQSSHTVRHIREPEGTIKRMSVSLLVDSEVRFEGTGPKAKRIVEAPSADKLKAIHELVAGVIGLSPERGDQLVVEALPFELTLNPEQLPPANPTPAAPPTWQDQFLKNRVFVIGVGVGAALLLALLVVIVRMGKSSRPGAEVPGELAAGATPDQIQGQIESRLAEQAAQRQRQENEALNALAAPPVTKKTTVLAKHISEQAKKDSASMAHVLRTWMSESGDEIKH
jgi:flagellar M-ring protein FliF